MKVKIRNSVFETNSSSVHTIAIAKYDGNHKNTITLKATLGEFGWEHELYMLPEDKLSYLWTAVYCLADNIAWNNNEFNVDADKQSSVINEWEELITNEFAKYGVNIEYEYDTEQNLFGYYIDHSNELIPMLNDFKENPELMVDFVLADYSNVETYNDNDEYTSESPGAEYVYVFTKGN